MLRHIIAATLLLLPCTSFAGDCSQQMVIEGLYEMHAHQRDAALQITHCEEGVYKVLLNARSGPPQQEDELSGSFAGTAEFENNRGFFRSEDNDCNLLLILRGNAVEIVYPTQNSAHSGNACRNIPVAGRYKNLMVGLPQSDESSF